MKGIIFPNRLKRKFLHLKNLLLNCEKDSRVKQRALYRFLPFFAIVIKVWQVEEEIKTLRLEKNELQNRVKFLEEKLEDRTQDMLGTQAIELLQQEITTLKSHLLLLKAQKRSPERIRHISPSCGGLISQDLLCVVEELERSGNREAHIRAGVE